jgi:DNA polymerase V
MPDLVPAGTQQLSLFSDESDIDTKHGQLMEMIDNINRTHGRHTLRYASENLSAKWRMRQGMKSPAYTTSWAELPVAKTV